MTFDSSLITTEEKNGAVIKFQCRGGRELIGNEEIYCEGRKFVGDPPICKDRIPEFKCDFEKPDLCGWTQDIQDDFQWTMGSRRTPTAATGPERDHTYPNKTDGHYMYIETSAPRQVNDFARLLSPYYNLTDGGLCFDFWYHMKGPGGPSKVGKLEVFIVEDGDVMPDPANSSFVPDFYLQGNQGDQWRRGKIQIGARYRKYQFVIVGTRLNSYVSDIAIDDVRVYNCSEDAELTTAETTLPYDMTTLQTDLQTTTTVTESTAYQEMTSHLASETVSKLTGAETTNPSTLSSTSKIPMESTIETTISTKSQTMTPSTSALTSSAQSTMTTTMVELPITTVETEVDTIQSTESSTSPSKSSTSPMYDYVSTSGEKSSSIMTSKQVQVSSVGLSTETLPREITTIKRSVTTLEYSKIQDKSTIAGEVTTEGLSSVELETTPFSSTTFVNETFTEMSQNDSDVSITTKRPAISSGDQSTKKPQIIDTSNETDSNPNNNPEPPNVVLTPVDEPHSGSKIPVKPLMIGVGVGVAIGLIIVIIGVYLWIKRKRRKELEFADEMRPIAKSGSHEW
ncbi:hypothetical protein FSP39_010315 [Pinctada imbricata]|uniref:MAM domain-containing protein n=1 Tax=Pinctada imbricata TaxID=66713 RepID=A0AA88YCR3_PINIB|nr:hypothetical protein FSP39_010315 [Pinctada imbricata]